MGGLSVARLRHQPTQALLVAALSGMLALTAVLGLSYARAVEESVQHTVIEHVPAGRSGVSVSLDAPHPPSPEQLRRDLGSALTTRSWAPPIGGAVASGVLDTRPRQTLVPVIYRDGVCAHLSMQVGRCSQGAGEALVSRAFATRAGVRVGGTLSIRDAAVGSGPAVLRGLRVVGIYDRPVVESAYWFGHPLASIAPPDGPVDGGEAVLVGWPTLRSDAWRTVLVQVDVPLAVDAVSVGSTPGLRADLRALDRAATAVHATAATQLPAVLATAATERAQARAPMPLLALQAVLLALVVLGYVAGATTEQRRPEVALARLRGQLPAAAARMLVRDLAVVVVLGCAVGAVLGWLLAAAAARHWLAPGTPTPWDSSFLAATAAAAALALVAVTVTAVPTVREPLVSLLRSVPPRSSAARAGLVDGVVVALCVAGLVTLLTGEHAGPTTLLVPGLLALAGGLGLAHVTVPAAAVLGRWQLRRGKLRSGLAAVAIARRPALRRLVAIETVAVALLVFAAAAQAVAADQRDAAAALQAGAPVVLTTDGALPRALATAVQQADPSGRYATAVLVSQGSDGAANPGSATTTTRTLAVDPERFGRIARWPGGRAPGQNAPALSALVPQRLPAPVSLRGSQLHLDTTFVVSGFTPGRDESAGLGSEEPVMGLTRPVRLVAVVVPPDGIRRRIDLGRLQPGRQRLAAAVPCSAGCRLREFAIERNGGDTGIALLDLTVRAAQVDGRAVDLRATDRGWAGYLSGGYFSGRPPIVDGRGGVHLRARAAGGGAELRREDVPGAVPALVAGRLPGSDSAPGSGLPPAELVTAPGLAGQDLAHHQVGSLTKMPSAGGRAAVVALPLATEVDGGFGQQAISQVWLGADDRAREAALVSALHRNNINVMERTSARDIERRMSEQGTGLSLHLATLVGLVSVLLAAAVLAVSVATSVRVRSLDLAGLRVAGVPRGVLVGAAAREQLVVALVGIVAGALLGAVGTGLTLARAPVPDGMGAPYLQAALVPVALAVAGCAVLLIGVCVGLGVRLGRVAVPQLLREGNR